MSASDEGTVNYGLAVKEYINNDGRSRDGYLYSLTDKGLKRLPMAYGNDDNDTTQFSVVQWHQAMDELHDLRESDDLIERQRANEVYDQPGARSFQDIWEDVPFVYPTEEEIAALASVLVLACPYAAAR